MHADDVPPATVNMSIATNEPRHCIARPPSPQYGTSLPAGGGGGKDFTERTLKSLKVSLGKLWRRRSVTITEYDPTYKCAYLGNVLTGWAKGEGCVEKPLSTLWKNYTSSSKPDVQMKVTVTHSGLKAVTKEHGLTEYWSHRVTYCAAPAAFPRIFCWVYRHEGRKLKQELRCHAVLCSKEAVAKRMATQLRSKLAQALHEFKRDKICRQNARLSLANSVYENPSLPRRKILLSTGSHNYRPPLERSKSAPKLMSIEESLEEEEETFETHSRFLLRIHSVPMAREEVERTRLFPRRFDVRPVAEEELFRGGRKTSLKRVNWAEDKGLAEEKTEEETERLREEESDENSLQSISSSGSEETTTAATRETEEEGRGEYFRQEEDILEDPTGGGTTATHLMKRSVTFPPPTVAHSLSDEEEEEEEEAVESDESGYAELTDKDEEKILEEKDSHHIIKSILRVNARNAHCVQV